MLDSDGGLEPLVLVVTPIVRLADPEAGRSHRQAALHRRQERADQGAARVGLFRRDRHCQGVAHAPR